MSDCRAQSLDGRISILIRSLQIDDLPAVMNIERSGHSRPWSENAFRDCFRPDYRLWAATVESELVGYAIVAQLLDEAHLLNLCVAPSWQSRGIGRDLLRHLIDEAFEAGMTRVLLEVRLSNDNAVALYESEGFERIGLRPGYYPGGREGEDALVLARQSRGSL